MPDIIRQSFASRGYEDLIHAVEAIVWMAPADTLALSFISQQAERMLGYACEEWTSNPGFWQERIHPQDREKTLSAIRQAVAKKESLTLTYRMIARDGRVLHFQDRIRITEKEPGVLMLNGIKTEVSAAPQFSRVQDSEIVMRSGDSELATILESITDGMIAVNSQKRVTYVNFAAEKMLGVTRTTLQGEHYSEVFPTLLDPLFYIESRRSLEEKLPVRFSAYFEMPGCWFEISIFPQEAGGMIIYLRDVSREKNAEAHSLRLTDRIKYVVDRFSDGFFTLDRYGNFTSMNPAALQLWRLEEFPTQPVQALFPNWDNSLFGREFARAITENSPVVFQAYYPPFDSWFEANAYPYRGELTVFMRDITLKKRQEILLLLEKESLRESTATHQSLSASVSVVLHYLEQLYPGIKSAVMLRREVHRELTHLAWSGLSENYRKAVESLSFEELEALFASAFPGGTACVTPDITSDERWEKLHAEALESGIRACWSFPVENYGALLLYFNTDRSPSPQDMFNMERVAGTIQMLAVRKAKELALQTSRERYELVTRATNEAIWDRDLRTNEVYWGEGFYTLFGQRSYGEVLNFEQWKEHLHPEDAEEVIRELEEFLTLKKENPWVAEYRYRKADGTYAYVLDRGYVTYDNHGEVLRIAGAILDITSRKETEILLQELNETLEKKAEELLSSNAELERFAYIASHDLQEPLRMVSSFLQLLRKKYKDQLDETADRYIDFAVDGAERMKKLILDLLEYSRLGSNVQKFSLFGLKELIEEVCTLFSAQLKESGAVVEVASLPLLYGHRDQIGQLFQNLIGNALKYRSQDAPHIRIGCSDKDSHWEFFVADNGIGIESRFFEKVFIIFQRLHNKSEYSGTGIGLAICKKIVERHKGKIWLDSEPGRGSTFRFTLAKNIPDSLSESRDSDKLG